MLHVLYNLIITPIELVVEITFGVMFSLLKNWKTVSVCLPVSLDMKLISFRGMMKIIVPARRLSLLRQTET